MLFIAILISDAQVKGAGGIATITTIMEEAEYHRLMDVIVEAREHPKALPPMFRTADAVVDPRLIVATCIVDESGEASEEEGFKLDTSDIENKDDEDFEN